MIFSSRVEQQSLHRVGFGGRFAGWPSARYLSPGVSRTERLFDLLQLLRTYHYPVTASKLAKELEVTVRTVYRDIVTLQALGAPVEGAAGVGYILRPGFLLPPLMFNEEEVEAIVLGARWVESRADGRLQQAARSALARISAVLPANLRRNLQDVPLLIGPGKGTPDAEQRLILLRRAIRQQHKVKLKYRSLGGETSERVVWPFALSFFDSARVLVAWCELRTDYRSFRADMIEDAQILAQTYPRNRGQLLQEWKERESIPR